MIQSITDEYGPFNEDDMKIKKNRYNELALILKDKKDADLSKLCSLYTDVIEQELQCMNPMNKPCELSVLLNEEQQLKDYLDNDYTRYNYDDIALLEEELNQSMKRKSELESKLSQLISSKPLKVDNPNVSKDDCHKNVLKCFKTMKDFDKFVSSVDDKTITGCDNSGCDIMSYNTYKKLSSDKKLLEKKLECYNNDVIKLDEDFKPTTQRLLTEGEWNGR